MKVNKFFIEFSDEEVPKYIQIVKHIKKMIDENIIEDGEKLPAIRRLAEILNVNNVTIVNAYKRLENEGYAIQKIGSGTYSKKKENTKSFNREYSEIIKKLTNKELKSYIDFAGETTSSEFFPVSTFKYVLNEVLDRDGAEALIYQDPLGFYGLRSSINNFFWDGKLDLDSILIVSGAQQGIDILSKALLNVNDSVIVEKPTYSGALTVFKWRRVNIYEASMEADGVNIKEFENIVKKNRIKLFYTMSYFQNPSTFSYSGVLSFTPPADWAAMSIATDPLTVESTAITNGTVIPHYGAYSIDRYWIRFSAANGTYPITMTKITPMN